MTMRACWPSIRKISEKANLSEPIAKKYLNALIEVGVVKREEREDHSGRQDIELLHDHG
jgi:predicted transcriptional regulator